MSQDVVQDSGKDGTNKRIDVIEVPKDSSILDVEAAKAVLPFWPRIYCKLSNDNDRRIREWAQKAHLQGK